jgi:hypothetical protein
VFLALGIQHDMRTLPICALSGSTIFFHIISSMAQFLKETKKVIENKMWAFFTTFV